MGIILFKNLDIGFVPKTPATPFPNSIKEASFDKSSLVFLEYAHKFGHPVSYMQ